MKSNFISNSEDVFSANEAQVKKIEFLTRQKTKTDMYIKDLEESLRYNKQAVIAVNKEGPNNKAINILQQENSYLHKRLQDYYEQNRDLNALRLFEAQIRIQDRSFYNERVQEFENRISDLRKYLHDKEDSFTNVVNRLRKYQDIGQLTIKEKLSEFKNQFGQLIHHEIIAKISEQRNFYRVKYEQFYHAARKVQILEASLKTNKSYEDLKSAMKKYEKESHSAFLSFEQKALFALPKQVQQEIQRRLQHRQKTNNNQHGTNNNNNKNINPNIELIRLLKKQKLSNQILQQALNEAIEKNEQLLNLNERLAEANNDMQETCRDLRSNILVLESQLSEFEQNYRRKLRDYSKCDIDKPSYKLSDFSNDISRRTFLKKIQKDVESISNFMNSVTATGKKVMNKSSSLPRTIVNTGITQQDIEIEQY